MEKYVSTRHVGSFSTQPAMPCTTGSSGVTLGQFQVTGSIWSGWKVLVVQPAGISFKMNCACPLWKETEQPIKMGLLVVVAVVQLKYR